jgi:lysophospholipase L1-like esterase
VIFWLGKPNPTDDVARLYRPHPYRVYMLAPGARSVTGRFSINSQGFRGPEIAVPKPLNTVRIVCLGDSTTFNDNATTDGHTYPAQMERLLREHYAGQSAGAPRIEVISAGVPGYTSLEALIYFESKLLDYNLDVAIFALGLNDALFMACFPDFVSDYTHARKVFEIPRPRLWERSALLTLLVPGARTIANPFRSNPKRYASALPITDPARLEVDDAERRRCFKPERINVFLRNVRNFAFVARGQGVTPVLSTTICGPEAGFQADVIGQMNERLRQTAASLSIPCVDLAGEMPWSAAAFEDNSQPRDCPEGLERMGRIVAEFLIRERIVEKAVAGRNAGGSPR